MKKIISERVTHQSFYSHWKDIFIKEELYKRSTKYNKRRLEPIAVFCNDYIGTNISVHGVYEGEHINDLFCLLNKIKINIHDSTAIDIGANIGNHSVEFSKYFANVISLEPNPRTFEILAANTKRMHNIKIHNWGCSSSEGKIRFQENFNNIGGSSGSFHVASDNEIEISVKPLDEIIKYIKNLALIKIDVEGMEFSALKGAAKIIEKFHPVICIEQHEMEFESEFRETKSLDWLRSKGYRIFSLAPEKRRNFILRRLINIRQLLFGITERRTIAEYERLPKATYLMIYAIHSSKL